MTQPIDPAKLSASAEHLEWTLKQHLGSEPVKRLLEELTPLLEAAKKGLVSETLDRGEIPGAKDFAEGTYIEIDRDIRRYASGPGRLDQLAVVVRGCDQADGRALSRPIWANIAA